MVGLMMWAGCIHADMVELEGVGSDTGVPLIAEVTFDYISLYEMEVQIVNTAYNGGPQNRITYFGLQAPIDSVIVEVVGDETDGGWDAFNNKKLPGAGANTFSWLFKTEHMSQGLNLDEQLVLRFTATDPLFSSDQVAQWSPTNKNGYLYAAKFQSVADDGEDSGVAWSGNPPDPSGPPPVDVVPEPTTASIVSALLTAAMLRRRRTVRRG